MHKWKNYPRTLIKPNSYCRRMNWSTIVNIIYLNSLKLKQNSN